VLRLGTARVIFANRAAHELAGGAFPMATGAEGLSAFYGLYHADGRPLADDEAPIVRAARGERFSNVRVDWDTPLGRRTVLVAGGTITTPGAPDVGIVTFEDITAVEAARRRADALAEAGAVLGGSLDARAMAMVVARLAVPRLTDWCAVELVRADGSVARAAAEGGPEPRVPARIPLQAADQEVGALLVAPRGGDSLDALRDLADRCALSLENARLYGELRSARDELEAIFAGVADAVTVQSGDGRLRHVNEAAVRLLGVPIGLDTTEKLLAAEPSALAAAFDLLDEDGRPFPFERLPSRMALTGVEPPPVIARFHVRSTGEERWVRLKSRPLRGPDGTVTHAINVVEDITDLKQAEQTQRLLAEAGRVLASSLDYEATLSSVAWLLVPTLADWCMVDLWTDHGLERVAVAHADPAGAPLAEGLRGLLIDPSGTEGPAAVARTGRSELHADVDDAHIAAAAHSARHHELLVQLGVRSALSVPMTLRGHRLGALTLSVTGSGRRIGPEQLELAEEFARRAAVAVDNARTHRQRSAIARTLQNSLLPPVLPEIPGLDGAALYRPAGEGTDVGGDFYDLFSVADDEWIAVIGDVCGKGAEAAAVTALARYTIRTAAVRRRSPARILAWLNDAMRRQDLAGRFCTITCVHLDTSRASIRATAACGGHPPALLRRAGGAVEEVGAMGTLLGLMPDPTLSDMRTELGPGDALVLYTDGITEARAPQRVLSEAELKQAIAQGPAGSAQALVEHVAAVAMGKEGTPPRDDIAVLALHARG
jgi:serine phosphatase RsbU (regulator of sigma subunit)/PAS domain-containing protein